MSKLLLSLSCFRRSMEKRYFPDSECKSTILRLFVLTLVLTRFSLPTFAQDAIDWKIDTTVNGVEFFHAIVKCEDKKFVFLKVNNKNNQPVKISWKEEFVVRKSSDQKKGPYKQKQLTVQPGSTSISNCSADNTNRLLTYPDQESPVYDEDIVSFRFRNIRVAR